MTTQAIIVINGFSTPLSDYIPPEELANLVVDDTESKAENLITAGGLNYSRILIKVAEPTPIKLNSNLLKIKDPVLYRALSKAGNIGNGGRFDVGTEYETYELITVNSPLKTVGNSGSDNEVTITFAGSGKR